jgi:hypothetical protein
MTLKMAELQHATESDKPRRRSGLCIVKVLGILLYDDDDDDDGDYYYYYY